MSINDTEKSRGRGRPPKDTAQIGLRLDSSCLRAVDAFASDLDVNPDAPIQRPEAIRRILRDWLAGHEYLSDGSRQEDAT